MTLMEFIEILEAIEECDDKIKVAYNLHEGIRRLFGAFGNKPSYFFKDVQQVEK